MSKNKNTSKITEEALRGLDPQRLTPTQQRYIDKRLSGMSCKQIAEEDGVSLQCVYKTLWKAIDAGMIMTDRPEYARLTRPQARCVYKNFAAEMRVRGIRSYTIADALSLPRNSISNYLYEKKSLPLTVAINIRDKFFPDLTLEYLFERSVPGPSRGVSLQNINETDCKYPYICRDIDAGRVRVDEMAAAVNQSEIDLLVKFSRCALTIEEAITIRDRFFPGVDIKTLFEQSLS